MSNQYVVKKVLNNNALVALDDKEREVILLGKGIGFNRSKGSVVSQDSKVEQVFILSEAAQEDQMVRLFTENDPEVLQAVNEYVHYVAGRLGNPLATPFAIALIDHLSFAIKRLQQGFEFENPFLYDVRILYPYEFELAKEGADLLEKRLQIIIPPDEIGFLALHLHSGRTSQQLGQVNRFSSLIAKVIGFIEQELEISIDKTSLNYSRLITHLKYTIERVTTGLPMEKENTLGQMLQKEYPLCYNIAWKVVKILQNELRFDVPEAEVAYLTLHIQRIHSHLTG